MKAILFVLFVALLMAGCAESTSEIEDKPSSLVADVDEVVEWVMDNYSSMESNFANAENDLRSSDAPVIKILDDLAKLVSDRRIKSEDKKKKLIALKEELESKKGEIEKDMTAADSSMKGSYGLALEKIEGKLDAKIKPLLDFDFQYLEKFEMDLNEAILEWKRYLGNVNGVLEEGLIRNELANRISDHFLKNMAKPIEERRGKWGKGVAPVLLPDLGIEMLWVKPGSFSMGSPVSEAKRNDDEAQYQVTLTKGFYLGKHEVTQAQWEQVMGSNPSEFKGADRPVEKVSWGDAVAFCKKLTETERRAGRLQDGMDYQLPTEAQWEYACRAGTTWAFSWGNTVIASNANYDATAINQTRDVGQYAPNPWGFFDMHGNVGEWCADWYGNYPSGAVRDPVGPETGSARVARGGSWRNDGMELPSARRGTNSPSGRHNNLGFRVGLRANK